MGEYLDLGEPFFGRSSTLPHPAKNYKQFAYRKYIIYHSRGRRNFCSRRAYYVQSFTHTIYYSFFFIAEDTKVQKCKTEA